MKLYAIYTPHITEYLYHTYYRSFENQISLHLLRWDTTSPADPALLAFGEKIKTLLSEVRRYKTENGLSMKASIASITIPLPEDLWCDETERDLAACTHAETILRR